MSTANLHARVLAAPEDMAQRLVYADVLAESGAIDEAAVIVAAHVLELARSAADDDYDPHHEADLLERYLVCEKPALATWTRRLSKLGVVDITLTNGLVDTIRVRAKELVRSLDAIFAVAPIRHLTLVGVEELRTKELAALLASPHLDRLETLAFHGATMDLSRMQATFAEKSIALRVPCLDLAGTHWDTLSVQNFRPPHKSKARKVVLSETRSRDVGAPRSGSQMRAVGAELLTLFSEATEIVMHGSARSITQIIPAIQPRRLERLDLTVLPRNAQSVPAIQCARFCAEKTTKLTHLRLCGFMYLDAFVKDSLAGAPFLEGLRELHLGDHGFWSAYTRPDLVSVLRKTTALESLLLDAVKIEDDLAAMLLSTTSLRSLSLRAPSLTEKSMNTLIEHPTLRRVSLRAEPLTKNAAIRTRLITRFGPGIDLVAD